MSRGTVRRLAQLVAVLVCCFLVPAFAQSAQGGSRLTKVQISLHGHRVGPASGRQSPVRLGNVRAADDLGTCVYSCDTEHGVCDCSYVPDSSGQGASCCAYVCGDCLFGGDDLED